MRLDRRWYMHSLQDVPTLLKPQRIYSWKQGAVVLLLVHMVILRHVAFFIQELQLDNATIDDCHKNLFGCRQGRVVDMDRYYFVPYPRIAAVWKAVAMNQHDDSWPGSSSGRVEWTGCSSLAGEDAECNDSVGPIDTQLLMVRSATCRGRVEG